MGASGNMAAMSSMVEAGTTAVSAYSQSESIKTSGAYQKQTQDMNAAISRFKAQDAVSRGKTAELEQIGRTEKLKGAQIAAQGAGGVSVQSGSAAAVRSSSQLMGDLDAQTIRNNAWREAWGYTVQAGNQERQGQIDEQTASFNASNTLLTGGLRAVGYGLKAYERYPKKNEVDFSDFEKD